MRTLQEDLALSDECMARYEHEIGAAQFRRMLGDLELEDVQHQLGDMRKLVDSSVLQIGCANLVQLRDMMRDYHKCCACRALKTKDMFSVTQRSQRWDQRKCMRCADEEQEQLAVGRRGMGGGQIPFRPRGKTVD